MNTKTMLLSILIPFSSTFSQESSLEIECPNPSSSTLGPEVLEKMISAYKVQYDLAFQTDINRSARSFDGGRQIHDFQTFASKTMAECLSGRKMEWANFVSFMDELDKLELIKPPFEGVILEQTQNPQHLINQPEEMALFIRLISKNRYITESTVMSLSRNILEALDGWESTHFLKFLQSNKLNQQWVDNLGRIQAEFHSWNPDGTRDMTNMETIDTSNFLLENIPGYRFRKAIEEKIKSQVTKLSQETISTAKSNLEKTLKELTRIDSCPQ